MHALLAVLSLALPAVEDWTPLHAPSVCLRGSEAPLPPLLSSGSHLELVRGEIPGTAEDSGPLLPYSTFLQMVEEDARSRSARLEVQRFQNGALVRGDAATIAAARAVQAALDAAGRALDVDVSVRIAPSHSPTGGGAGDLGFQRRVRSGDTTFFGTRDMTTFVAGFDVEVADNSGSSTPVMGRAHHGIGLHLTVCRIDGGRRVHLQGVFDAAEIAETTAFDPGTPDLGVMQQPRVVFAQVAFAGTVDSAGKLSVVVNGAPLQNTQWTLEIQARTQPDPAPDAPLNASFVVFDLGFAAATSRGESAGLNALFYGQNGGSRETGLGSLPPSAIASLVESARAAGPRGARAPLYWSDRILIVPRSDAAALAEARALVRGIEAVRLQETQVELALGPVSAQLPVCAASPGRFVVGTERPLVVEYRLEVAPQVWMPSPIVETTFNGTAFDLTAQGDGVSAALWSATSGPIVELARETAQVGRLQTVTRRVNCAVARAEQDAPARIALSGTDVDVAVIRCRRP
ncbi:MAG: hypothetical protein JNL28_07260 [Planctomycetes bacterium]|nr:hypothetical protein [Planctomycetota bacterium]